MNENQFDPNFGDLNDDTFEAVISVYQPKLRSCGKKDAELKTRRILGPLINKHQLDAAFNRIEELRKSATTVNPAISTKEDLVERGWYLPNPDGDLWRNLREQMQESSMASAIPDIDRESDAIVSATAEPQTIGDKRKGLVIGNVQSGKTANYAAVIAKAVDAGYKLIVVLAGLHNNLRSQTQKRLDRDLGVEQHPHDWFRLTSEEGDLGPGNTINAEAIATGNLPVLAVVKKNKSRLENLLAFLDRISNETRKKLPTLIIDDESDQATPDASGVNAQEATAINRLVRKVWSEVHNGTYIGYTATPFANVFMSSEDNRGDGHGVDLYPDDFIYAMKTPDAYFGARRLFGIDSEDPADWSDNPPDVVRSIPEWEKDELVPSSRVEIDFFEPRMTKTLEDAIKWFVVASAIRRTRGQEHKHSSMLVHTTHAVELHFNTKRMIDEFLAPLREKAFQENVEDFRDVFLAEAGKASELYSGNEKAPTWNNVAAEIPTVLWKLTTVVDNSKADPLDRLDYTKDTKNVIAIGGGTLSRGLTLEGLFVSYFTRSSNTYDTLLQMGRWFGYRHGYEDLQRIWLSEGLDEDYRHLALVEEELREEVRTLSANYRPSDITVRIRQHPGRLQITNPNKMKNVQKVETDFEGYRMQTYKFDLDDPTILGSNLALTDQLLEQIRQYSSSLGSEQARLFTDVPLDAVESFVTRFRSEPEHDEVRASAMKWAREKLPTTKWNVAVVGGSGPKQTLLNTGFPVMTVTRAPIASKDPRHPNRLNIRTLMTGNDYALDLVLQGYKLASEEKTTIGDLKRFRQSPDCGKGRGFLALYPISRNSAPRKQNRGRQPMAAALDAISPDLATPDDESQPIMACAIIMPWDVGHTIKNKGTFVGVIRNEDIYDSADESVENMPEDREGDYQ